MRKLFLLPILVLASACNDHTLIEPEVAVTPDLALAQVSAQKGGLVKMVPCKGKGHLKVVGQAMGCGGDPSLLTISVEAEVRGTHVGHSYLTMTACWTPSMEFVEGTGTFTAANGDELFVRGSWEDYETIHPFYPDGTWEFGPLHFEGGTGRFAGAEGVIESWGAMNASMEGPMMFEGDISSVGSIK